MTYPDPATQPEPGPPRRSLPPAWLGLALAAAVVVGAGAALAATGLPGHHHAAPAATSPAAPPPSTANPGQDCADAGGAWDGASCTYPTPAPSGPAVLAIGQPEELADNAGTTIGTVTVTSVTVTTRPADPAYGSRPANGRYVIVHVKATADPGYMDGFGVYSGDFYVLQAGSHYEEGGGNAYEALTDAQSNAGIAATLGAGETATGWEAFDVPARHGSVVYSPNSDGQPLAEWKF
jgi:hypothetical protein